MRSHCRSMQDSTNNMFGSSEGEKSREVWKFGKREEWRLSDEKRGKRRKIFIPLSLVLTSLKINKLENIPPFLDVIKLKWEERK